MNRRLTDKQAQGILVAGTAILALDFTLALYSVPSVVSGLPTFPFFSLPFPLLSLLIVLGTGLIAMGWVFHSRGSFSHILVGSATVTAGGLIWAVISFISAIPFNLGGMTIFIEPYGAHATLVLAVGLLLGLFGSIFWGLDRLEKRREKRLSEQPQPSTQD